MSTAPLKTARGFGMDPAVEETINRIVDALDALGAKLDADSGVGDTNYLATTFASIRKINP